MRTRLATVATSTLAALVAACSAAGPGTTAPTGEAGAAGPRSQPPVVHVTGRDLSTPPPGARAEQAHAGRSSPGAPTERAEKDVPAAADNPADVAAGLVTDLLAAEGLTVTSIDTRVEVDDGAQAQVRVDVAHSPGQGHPVQSRYLLELVRDAGRWRLVSSSEPG